MQIFEAAIDRQESNTLGALDWKIYTFTDGKYYIARDVADSHNEFKYTQQFIRLQRGGVRFFKTIDAAANAIRQIGQFRVDVYLGQLS